MRAITPSLPPHTYLGQGRRRPTPKYFATAADGTNMRQSWSARCKATAIGKIRRRYVAARINLQLYR
jgi:hypothetical protein